MLRRLACRVLGHTWFPIGYTQELHRIDGMRIWVGWSHDECMCCKARRSQMDPDSTAPKEPSRSKVLADYRARVR